MKSTVVYLDDEQELGEIFAEMFSSEEVNVFSFTDPLAAIAYIVKDPPNLIFFDYNMPRTNGDDLAYSIGKDIPIALVTGDLQINTKYPFCAILTKPYERAAVQALINKYCQVEAI